MKIAGGADDITDDFHTSSHAAEFPSFTFFSGRGDDFGNRLTETGDANGLPRLSDLFQDAKALGFELGDGNFFHTQIVLWSMTIVKRLARPGYEGLHPNHPHQLFHRGGALIEPGFFFRRQLDLDDLL